LRTQRWGGYSIPVLERPLIWDRRTGGNVAALVVADPGMVETEAQRQDAFAELRRMSLRPVGGGDTAPYVTCVSSVIATGTTLAGTAQGLIPSTASPAFAAGVSVTGVGGFWYVSRSIRVILYGVMTTAASTPGTFTPDWKVDTAATGTTGNTLGAGPASATLATSITNGVWKINATVVCQTISGTAGKLWGHAHWQPNTTLFTTQAELFMPNVSPAQATVDTTQNSFIKFLGTLGSASDNMACTMALWETMN
jgi:hypothetical protein